MSLNAHRLIASEMELGSMVKGKQSFLDLFTPTGWWEKEASRIQDNRHIKVVRLSAIFTDIYPLGNIPDTHSCQRLIRPQDHSAVGMELLKFLV